MARWGTRRTRWDSDRGESLVEVLVALVILGIAGVAVVAGLQMSVTASDIHRKQTTGGAYVRSFAEAIEQYVAATPGGANYQPCAAANAYKVGAVVSQLDLPNGYSATQDAAKSVGPTGTAAAGCASDTGIQQVTLHVSSGDDRASERLTIVLRKPCAGVTPCTS